MYKRIIRPFLFSFKPETIHRFTFITLKVISWIPGMSWVLKKMYARDDESLHVQLWDMNFNHPVGIAAGLDKNVEATDVLANLGFSFIEIGTITPRPQPGNPKPRSFRLPKDEALINRMGFNNEGVENAVKKLKKRKEGYIIGGNIGKNTATSNEDAREDYLMAFKALYDYCDYFVVNVSCPNVKNLRDLMTQDILEDILEALKEIRAGKEKKKPILLKVSPDSDTEHLNELIAVVEKTNIDGFVATNTTISRENLSYSQEKINEIGDGGLSGRPLKQRATEVIRYLHQKTSGKFPIIGVGGIMTVEDAMEKLDAGASLVQLYTGFIYEGPALSMKIRKAIKEKKAR